MGSKSVHSGCVFLKPLRVRNEKRSKRSNSLIAGGTITLLTSSMLLLLSFGLWVGYEGTLSDVLSLQELGCSDMLGDFGIAHPEGALQLGSLALQDWITLGK